MSQRWFIMKMQSYPDSGRTVLEGTHFANKLVAVFETPEAAQAVVDLHNAILDKREAVGAEPANASPAHASQSHSRDISGQARQAKPPSTMLLSHLVPERDARRIRALERTVGELREHIRQLEELLIPQASLPPSWYLTPAQTRLFQALLAREVLTKEHGRYAVSLSDDEHPSDNYIKVQVYQLRSKLARYGVEIKTVWGTGYRLGGRLSWRAKLGCKSAGPGISPPEPAPQ